MNELTLTCTDPLIPITAYSCPGIKANRINRLIIGKEGHGLTVSGDVPTVSEFQAGLAASGDSKLVVVQHISNGLVDEVSAKELTDLDTETGLTERFDVMMGMTGNIKAPTADVLNATMTMNNFVVLMVWMIDNKGNCWGGKTGYRCAGRNAFSPKKMDGTSTYVSFSLNYYSDNVDDDYAQDDDYLTLDNS